ncbi:hypothetical protein [Herminiimonas sp. CN]|uniref:hypothetical protein n=1 Tax=Herminiimonas sp. CN TaxID=1349818 RepID=UPI0004742B41|nr:hypothetical protein [Herminiimonas sp. CN]
MRIEPQTEIDIHPLLPTKRQMVRVTACIVIPSLIGGLLLGLLILYAPRGALALALGDMFVAGGAAVFSAPGGARLALWAGLVWGLGFAFVAAFCYTAWLIVRVTRGYHTLVMEQKMHAYRRAIAGKQPE